MSISHFCHGYFSNEVKQTLDEDDSASASQPCAECGQMVAAENKAGHWVPKAHEPPSQFAPKRTSASRKH